MFPSLHDSARRLGTLAALLATSFWLAGCAPLKTATAVEFPVGPARLALPAGEWQDLGLTEVAVPLATERQQSLNVPTRMVVLRGAGAAPLAVFRVQAFRNPQAPARLLWAHACRAQLGVQVDDAAQGSPVRIDCLRIKRWANQADWLESNQPDFARTLARHALAMPQPATHLSYRLATEGGTLVDVQALVDQRLLRPPTQSNAAFLEASQPAKDWAQQLVRSVRTSVGMWDGYLPIPSFPMAIRP